MMLCAQHIAIILDCSVAWAAIVAQYKDTSPHQLEMVTCNAGKQHGITLLQVCCITIEHVCVST